MGKKCLLTAKSATISPRPHTLASQNSDEIGGHQNLDLQAISIHNVQLAYCARPLVCCAESIDDKVNMITLIYHLQKQKKKKSQPLRERKYIKILRPSSAYCDSMFAKVRFLTFQANSTSWSSHYSPLCDCTLLPPRA